MLCCTLQSPPFGVQRGAAANRPIISGSHDIAEPRNLAAYALLKADRNIDVANNATTAVAMARAPQVTTAPTEPDAAALQCPTVMAEVAMGNLNAHTVMVNGRRR